ncbi:MAG: fibronectin type III domain-containing protein, partial [Planctomycetota bacterium]
MRASTSSPARRLHGAIVLGLVVAVLLCLVAPATTTRADGAGDGDDAELQPIQWRVVFTTNPQHEMLIAWNTRAPGTRHSVCIDRQPHAGAGLDAYTTRVEAQRNGRFTGSEPALYYHHARISGLQAATTYWFRLVSDDQTSREFHVLTAPDTDKDFRLFSGGDSRSQPDVRTRMNRRMAALVKADPGILALAHGGDYVAYGTDMDLWDRWMSDHEQTTTDDGRVLPVIPARGNHEAVGPQYDEVFGWPGGGLGKNWFETKLSPQVLLVTLNTETATGGDQLDFLKTSLARHRYMRWQLAQYHRPAWPAVKRPSPAKTNWVPLFEQFNTDLVLENDGHVIKRTVPIRNDREAADGVVYIGEGGLGVSQRRPDTERWYLAKPGMASRGNHVFVLSFGQQTLRVRVIGEDGNTQDDHTLKARTR